MPETQDDRMNDYKMLQDAAQDPRVDYTVHWLRILCQERKIKAVKLGTTQRGTWLVNMPDLYRYVDEMKEAGNQKHNPWG
jgi:hypothetical protein